ncbi:MAG: hypothetical protein KDD82_01715 [Planctomycetes bacterium]|nr:hypothetical protein [Planctomycetota bacterium]
MAERSLAEFNDRCGVPVQRAARAALWTALAIFAWLVFEGRFLPSLGTDTLIYHLPSPATWLHEGFLAPLDFPFHDNGVEQSPMLSQSVFYLLMKLTGDAGLVWLVQPAFFVALVALYYRTARLLGASQALSFVLSAGVALFPPYLSNAGLANNDLILTTGCALTLYGLLLTRPRRARGLVVGASGVALMLLTKANGLLVTAVVFPAFAPALWAELRGADGRWRWRTPALACGIGVLGAAFFWKNLFVYGNPVWPGTVKVAGVTVFDGLLDYSLLDGWSGADLRRLLLRGDGVHELPGRLGAVLWLGSVASAVLLVARRQRRGAWSRAACCVWVPGALALLLVAAVPPEPRYVFPVWYALWLSLANASAQGVRLRRRELSAIGPALCLVLLLGAHPTVSRLAPTFDFWVVTAVFAVPSALLTPLLWARYRRLAAAGGLALVGLLALLGPTWYGTFREQREALRAEAYTQYYPDHGAAWVALDQLSAERPLCVAYAGTPLVFPLFGPRLRNRVVYAPLSADDHPQPVDLADRPDDVPQWLWPHLQVAVVRRRRVDDAYWLAKLAELEVDVLFLADDPFRGGIAQELGAIGRNPGRFELLGAAGGTSVYRVLPP